VKAVFHSARSQELGVFPRSDRVTVTCRRNRAQLSNISLRADTTLH